MEALKPFLVSFFTLQYPTDTPPDVDSFPDSAYYLTGTRDICLVITCIAVMAVLRDALRLGVFEPFARWRLTKDLAYKRRRKLKEKGQKADDEKAGNGHSNGHANSHSNGHTNGHSNGHANGDASITPKERRQLNRSVLRFAEQGWSVVYYTLQWSYGLYVHRNLPTRIFDPVDLWIGYPHISIAGPLKFYYLTQTAFYLHQMLILNAEERRKDHVQMMTHHVITVILMGMSYFMNFTRVGCVIMVLMDWCDIFLPLAKMLRYIDYQMACDAMFGVFLTSWFVTRHFLFLFVIKSQMFDGPRIKPLLPAIDWERGFFHTTTINPIFSLLLLSLQVLQIIWFWMICRTAWRVINGNPASDDRSDDEDEKDE